MTYREHKGWVVKVKIPHCGNGKIVSASSQGDIKFWDAKVPDSFKTFNTVSGNITSLDVHNYADVFAWWVGDTSKKVDCVYLVFI